MRVLRSIVVVSILLVLLTGVGLAGGKPLHAELSAANEVQSPPVASGATGTADVALNQGQGAVCWQITASGLSSSPTAAHIHRGPAGVNGPVVVGLFGAGTTLPASGCTEGVSKELVKEIRENPDAFYVNVHTENYPGGEIRGQLSK